MPVRLHPTLWPLPTFAGFISRHQAMVTAYLVEENRVLKEQFGGRRLRLTNTQHRRLAAKVKRIGRKALDPVATIVTPDTLMRWYKRLIADKWTYPIQSRTYRVAPNPPSLARGPDATRQ